MRDWSSYYIRVELQFRRNLPVEPFFGKNVVSLVLLPFGVQLVLELCWSSEVNKRKVIESSKRPSPTVSTARNIRNTTRELYRANPCSILIKYGVDGCMRCPFVDYVIVHLFAVPPASVRIACPIEASATAAPAKLQWYRPVPAPLAALTPLPREINCPRCFIGLCWDTCPIEKPVTGNITITAVRMASATAMPPFVVDIPPLPGVNFSCVSHVAISHPLRSNNEQFPAQMPLA